jgi:hypothetical protein
LIGSSAVLAPAASAEDEAPVIVSVDARPETVGLYKASRTQVIYDEHYSVPPVDDFSVKRNTDIRDFNVAEPVTRGATIRMFGRLLRLDPAAGYVGYGGKTVRVLFRPAGTSTWVSRGTVTTSSQGYFTNSRTFRAWRDGAWKVQFDGTVNYLPETSRADYVDTR